MIHPGKWEECSIIPRLQCINLFPLQEDDILRFLPLGFYLYFWQPYIFSKCYCLTTEISCPYAQVVIQEYVGEAQMTRLQQVLINQSFSLWVVQAPLFPFSLSPFPWLKSNLDQGWVLVYLSSGLYVIIINTFLMNKWILRKQNM